MPKRKYSARGTRKRSRFYKRTPVRIRRGRKVSTRYPSAIGGVLKATQNAAFLYKDTVRRSGTGSIMTQFRLNSPHDFDYLNVMANKQPLGWDNLATTKMYNTYLCTGWRTKLTITNRGTTPIDVLYTQADTAVVTDTRSEMLNWPGAVLRPLGSSTGGNNKTTIVTRGNPSRFFDLTGRADGLAAGFAADPTQVVFGTLLVTDSTGATVDVDVIVEHIFYTKLNDIRTAAS